MEFEQEPNLEDWCPHLDTVVLLRQVQNQSDTCDVTVQVGSWSKKFHWHVLVSSPFFECGRRSDVIAQRTGLVQMNVASPANTEAAILSLYGKKPKLTAENVSSILDLSEFLLIPHLKSACVSFLQQNVTITQDNCMKLNELSTLFEFELSSCYEFIERYFYVMLMRDDVLNLSTDSVIKLLSEPHRTPRATTKEKFEFAVRWAKHNESNNESFHEVFKAIDLETMKKEYLETVVLQDPLVSELRERHPNITALYKTHNVLIFTSFAFPTPEYISTMPCFDIQTQTWCMTERNEIFIYPQFVNLNQEIPERPDVYRVEDGTNLTLSSTDLHSNEKKFISKLYTMENIENIKRVDTLYRMNRHAFIAFSLNKGRPYTGVHPIRSIVRCNSCNYTLLYGRIHSPETKLKPILSIKNGLGSVRAVCMSNDDIIAILTCINSLLVYDVENCHLVNISLNSYLAIAIAEIISDKVDLASTENGFVLYFKERYVALDISRNQQSRFAYNVTKVLLKLTPTRPTPPLPKTFWKRNSNNMERYVYFFIKGMWYRVTTDVSFGAVRNTFECADHSDVMNAKDGKVIWKQLPPFKTLTAHTCDNVVMVHLPRSTLLCNSDCKYCTS